MINIVSQENQSSKLEIFLKDGGELVKQTEVNTKLWFALKGEDKAFAIFDAFNGADGQQAHFAGKVAAALKNSSDDLVENGWDKGVVANIKQYKVITNI